MHRVVSVIPALSKGSSSSLTDEGSSPQRAWARHNPFASVCVQTWAKNDQGDSENPASFPGAEASGDRVAEVSRRPRRCGHTCSAGTGSFSVRHRRRVPVTQPFAAASFPIWHVCILCSLHFKALGRRLTGSGSHCTLTAQEAMTLGEASTLAERPFPLPRRVQG